MTVSSMTSNNAQQQIRYLMWLMFGYYFLQMMGGNPGLHSQALDKYLVDNLGLNATSNAGFQFLIVLPFMVKPLWGVLTDFFPILGYRRKSYFILSGIVATVVCFFIWMLPAAPSFTSLATLFAFFMLAIAIGDVVCDGTMVEQGNPLNAVDKLQSMQWIAAGIAAIIISSVKGYIAQYVPLQNAILFSIGFPIATVVLTLLFLKEEPVTSISTVQKNFYVGLKQAFGSKTLWSCGVFLFLWNVSPNLGGAFYIYEKKVLLFSDVLIGNIDTVGSITSILGFASFIWFWNKLERVLLFKILIIAGVISTLSFLFLNNANSAFLIIALSSFIGSIARIAILSLAATACPKYAEAFIFSLLMSVINFGEKGGGILGGMIYDSVGYDTLIYIGAFTTLVMWYFLPLIREK